MTQQMPEDMKRQQDFLLGLFTVSGAFEGLSETQRSVFDQMIYSNTLQAGAYD